jgi:hypothetical protein
MAFWNKPPSPTAEAPLTCSFCGKSQAEVAQLIAGPSVYICDECVGLSADIVRQKTEPPPEPPTAASVAAAMSRELVGHESLVALLARLVGASATASSPPPTVLLVGPAGVGKTALCRALARGCGVPAAHAHAHRMTATGYIGADLENVVQEVVLAAGLHPGRAARGVLVIEDLHHLALVPPVDSVTRDVGGRDVQPHLVRLLDRRPLFLPDDPTRRVHPQSAGTPFDPSQLLVLLSCRLDPVPDGEPALREALRRLGLMEELLDRVDLVLPVHLPPPEQLAEVVRSQLAPAVAKSTAAELSLEPSQVRQLVARAQQPGGLWNVRQALVRRALLGPSAQNE